jgi:hypothetical protein
MMILAKGSHVDLIQLEVVKIVEKELLKLEGPTRLTLEFTIGIKINKNCFSYAK